VIRPVDTSLLDAVTKAMPNAPARKPADAEATAGKNAFATQLKRETQRAAETGGTVAAKTSPGKTEDARTRTFDRMKPPDGEKWRPVKGHDNYAEIVAGPRKGQYVNLTRGDRRGESFTIDERDGKKVHVYKKDGKDVVVPLDEDLKASSNRGRRPTPPKGETWAPVEGKPNYADILTGKRNGYYVNLVQGSVREGDVFHIVKRGDRSYHVYGEGKDKVWVEVGPNKKKKSEAAESTNSTPNAADNRDASQSTGGAAATSGSSGSGSSTGGASASSS
jgi:hypothetical protein